MEKYEILYFDGHTEVVDHDTMEQLVYELESFERDDISQIHLLKDDGDFDTIWTEEEGLFTKGSDDFDDDDEDVEYYEDGSELFSKDLSNIEGVVETLIDELDPKDEAENALRRRLLKIKDDKAVLTEIKDMCIDRVCESDTILDYISEYSVYELGEMDGIWNEFGDIIRSTIYEYFKF